MTDADDVVEEYTKNVMNRLAENYEIRFTLKDIEIAVRQAVRSCHATCGYENADTSFNEDWWQKKRQELLDVK